MKVLLVDDDRDLIELLTFALRRTGYVVVAAHDPATALKVLRSEQPDLLVLDVNLGPDDGFDLLRKVRQISRVPVIMLSGRSADDDKVLGLELGADDYVTKPFSPRELLARVAANVRRVEQGPEGPGPAGITLRVGAITLDEAAHSVSKGGQPLDLTVTEFRVLRYLMANAGRVVSTSDLLRHVWGYYDPSAGNVVRTAMHRLRQKL
ncbi:MAG: response regulator transcription factor, partial [Chloroflexota bacterium]